MIRKAFFICLIVAAYVWMVQTEQEAYVMSKAKNAYDSVVHWFDDVEVDYQVPSKVEKKKKSRRTSRLWF